LVTEYTHRILSFIIIIIGTTSHTEFWPPSEFFSTLLDSWLLPTNSLIPASLRPFPLHLFIWHAVFPLFLVLLVTHQSPRHTVLIHSCNMTSPPQPCNSEYHGEFGLFKRAIKFLANPALPLTLSLIRPYILRRIFFSNTSTIFSFVRDNVQHSAPYNIIGRTNVLHNKIFVVLDIKLDLKCFWGLK
jgi:hypothetical protein